MHALDPQRIRSRNAAAPATRRPNRTGFTLVEMLVAVTLVLLMMALLGEVFSIATDTVSTHRGLAENDQRARILQTVLDRDVKTRTFRDLVPFAGAGFVYVQVDNSLDQQGYAGFDSAEFDAWAPGDSTDDGTFNPDSTTPQPTLGLETILERRRGHFSYSENDPANPLDDVLSFTVDAEAAFDPGGSADDRLFGKATQLPMPAPGLTAAQRRQQPDFDDGLPVGDNTGVARYAQVSYFVRAGRLIRSVRLLRTPYFGSGSGWFDTDGDGISDPWPPAPAANGSYGRHFDFAAFRDPRPSGVSTGPVFLEDAALDNGSRENYAPATPPAPARFVDVGGGRSVLFPDPPETASLGLPYLRPGHGFSRYGRPREFTGRRADWKDEQNTAFLGGFLKSETAAPAFHHPGRAGFGGFGYPAPYDTYDDTLSPYTVANLAAPAGPTGSIPGLNGTAAAPADRRGEDVLLSHVHAFDIKVWDAAYSEGIQTLSRVVGGGGGGVSSFVDLGHGLTDPGGVAIGDFNAVALVPRHFNRADGVFDNTGVAAVFGGTAPRVEPDDQNPYGNRFDTWHPDMVRIFGTGAGAAFLPYPPPYRPLNVKVVGGLLRYGADGLPGRARVDDNVDGFSDFVDEGGITRTRINRRETLLVAPGPRTGGGALPDPNEIGALGSDDESPLRAMLITVRFYDPASDQLREVSFRHNLIDP